MRENMFSGFPPRSDRNEPAKSQKKARNLKLGIFEAERLYHLCSENKGADQLCSYCIADLCLCFLYMQKSGFVMMRLQWKDSQGQMVDE